MQLTGASVCASVLWSSALWTLTKMVENTVDSWNAGTTSPILGIEEGALQGIDVWWRRLHRAGHTALRLSKWAGRLMHRGGHMVRFSEEHWLAKVLKTRSVQWWRRRQCRHKDKWTGVYLKGRDLKVGDQPCKWHGDGSAERTCENTGWWHAR